MGVLHRMVSRAIRLWSQAYLRLKSARRTVFHTLNGQIHQCCTPLITKARRFFVLDGIFQAITQGRAIAARRGQSSATAAKQSISQTLLQQWRIKHFHKRLWISLLLSVLLLGTCFGQRFYSQPTLDIKATAPKTFYAPATATFEDKTETERRRSDVREGATPLLKVDENLTQSAFRTLDTILKQGTALRARADSPPFFSSETLSKPTQNFLFQASDAQWKSIWKLAATSSLSAAQLEQFAISYTDVSPQRRTPAPSEGANSNANPNANLNESTGSADTQPTPLLPRFTRQLKAFAPEQFAALRELVAYREQTGSQSLNQLKLQLTAPRVQYRQAAAELARMASIEGQPIYDYRLFELSDSQWLELEAIARQILTEMMLQGIPQGMPTAQLDQAIEAKVTNRTALNLRSLTVDILSAAAAPNLVIDEEGTKQLAEQAMKKIAPVMVSVQKGELIVAAGDTIDAEGFARLDHFNLTDRYFNWVGLSGFSILAGGVVAFYLWIDHTQSNYLSRSDHMLILLLCLSVALLAMFDVPAAGLPLVGLLIGSFYGAGLGLTVVLSLVLLLIVGTLSDPVPLMAGSAAAFVGAWIAPQLRAREEFALLGGFVGLTQGSVHLILTLMGSTVATPLWQVVFLESALHGLYGIAWSIAAMGISPYLEHFFDVVTPIRLAELANPNRPLLKRLSSEAPGTFQHTMFVANLAEAAARALGRNVELVRAGTLYHDIGKMHDPLGFIENQMGGPNKHDELDDPWLSAGIIKKHVTQGLVMARKYRLPKAVQAFIPEHQGDMKISYFYHQAKERQKKEPSLVVNDSDFTYAGPIPQSPETGITMLADSCEAALRSLTPEASIDDAYTMVDKILRARWRNRQLVDSGLSRDDMDLIASVFIQVWQQHNHKRIAYPK